MLVLDALTETQPGEIPVCLAGAALLAMDFNPGGTVPEVNTRGGLVDLLTSGTAAEHEGFFEVRFPDPEAFHSLLE